MWYNLKACFMIALCFHVMRVHSKPIGGGTSPIPEGSTSGVTTTVSPPSEKNQKSAAEQINGILASFDSSTDKANKSTSLPSGGGGGGGAPGYNPNSESPGMGEGIKELKEWPSWMENMDGRPRPATNLLKRWGNRPGLDRDRDIEMQFLQPQKPDPALERAIQMAGETPMEGDFNMPDTSRGRYAGRMPGEMVEELPAMPLILPDI